MSEDNVQMLRRTVGAAAILLLVLGGCGDGDSEPSTTGPSAETTGRQSGSSGTAREGGTDEGANGSAERQATRTERGSRRQEQGRLGAQTGGSPVQGEGFGATRAGGRVATIVLSGGGPVGGVQRVRFRRAKRVRLIVRSNTDEVVRIPGYGLRKRVHAGGSARFQFKTTKAGLFSIEVVRGQTRIGVLQIG